MTRREHTPDFSAAASDDPLGPKLARYVFERESCTPEVVAEVEAALQQSPTHRQMVRRLEAMGEVSRRALSDQSWTNLWPEIARRLHAELAAPQPTGGPSASGNPSMSIRFRCQSCHKKYEVGENHKGRKLKCSKCATVLVVPHESTIDKAGNDLVLPTTAAATAAAASMTARTMASDDAEKTAVAAQPPVFDEVPRAATHAHHQAPDYDPEKTVVAGAGIAPVNIAGGMDALHTPPPPRPAGASSRRSPATARPAATSERERKPVTDSASGAESPKKKKKKKGKKAAAAAGPMAFISQMTKPNTIPGMIAASVAAVLGIIGIIVLSSAMNSGNGSPDPAPVADATENSKKSPLDIIGKRTGGDVVIIQDANSAPDAAPLSIDCEFPPFGMAFEDVHVQLAATGGQKPYRWDLAAGSQLPDGLTLAGDVVQGSVHEPGKYEFGFVVTDNSGNRETMNVSWECDEKLTVDISVYPENPVSGKEYAHQFEANGGVEPYRWELLHSTLPEGLAFDSNSAILAGKTDKLGRFTLRLAVTDARDRRDIVRFRLEIELGEAPPQLMPPPNGGNNGANGNNGQPQGQPDGRALPRPNGPLGGRPADDKGFVGWQNSRNRDVLQKTSQLNTEGCVLMREGKLEEAIAKFTEMIQLDPRSSTAYYNLACAYALGNQKETAMKYLIDAVRNGFTDFDHILRDSDLSNLHDFPDFVELTKSRDRIEHEAADGKLAELQRQFPNYLCTRDEKNKFIFATNVSQEVLDLLTKRIENYAQSQWREIFANRPDYYIMIVLPSKNDFAQLRPSPNIGGWYDPQQRLLISGTVGHTLTHEFTHALHFADLGKRGQMHQIWFLEGMATVFEDSKLPDDPAKAAVPVQNARLLSVQGALNANKYKSWRELFAMNQGQFMETTERALISYGTARYICFWLWEQGKLAEFYKTYCDTYFQGRDGQTGIKAMEKMFGKKLEEIEADWLAWVKKQEFKRQSDVKLGVVLDNNSLSTGIRVARVQPGSAAAVAGIQEGDIILEIDGLTIDSHHNLTGALNEYQPGDVARVTIIRDVTDPATGKVNSVPKTLAVRLTSG